MKKTLIYLTTLLITVSLYGNKKEDARKTCYSFYTSLSKMEFSQAAAMSKGSLKSRIKSFAKATGTEKEKILKIYSGIRFHFGKINMRKKRAKIFVLAQTKTGALFLQKVYLKLKGGKWYPYRSRKMPFIKSIP